MDIFQGNRLDMVFFKAIDLIKQGIYDRRKHIK